jgi:hypothetical protein
MISFASACSSCSLWIVKEEVLAISKEEDASSQAVDKDEDIPSYSTMACCRSDHISSCSSDRYVHAAKTYEGETLEGAAISVKMLLSHIQDSQRRQLSHHMS